MARSSRTLEFRNTEGDRTLTHTLITGEAVKGQCVPASRRRYVEVKSRQVKEKDETAGHPPRSKPMDAKCPSKHYTNEPHQELPRRSCQEAWGLTRR